MKTPGVSITLGMAQGTQTPYVTANGRLGFLHGSKRLDLSSQKGIIAALAGVLLLNVVKKAGKAPAKKRVKKEKDVTSVSSVVSAKEIFKF